MQCLPETPLCAVQGDDEAYTLTFTLDGTDPLDLTGSTLKFVVVNRKDAPDSDAVISKSITTFALPLTGVANLALTHTDTDISLGTYFYRMKLIGADTKVKTIMKGTFSVQWAK